MENDGVNVPTAVRWLGRPADVKAYYVEGTIKATSITFTLVGQVTFGRLQKSGLRLLGRRYSVETFEEERPDAQRGRCGRWGHIEARCTRDSRCALCAQKNHTDRHKHPVEGARQARARRARTSLPSALTAMAPTSRMRTCARGSERPGRPQKGGSCRLHRSEERGRLQRPLLPPAHLRRKRCQSRGMRWRWMRSTLRRPRRPARWRSRGPGTRGTDCSWRISFIFYFPFF